MEGLSEYLSSGWNVESDIFFIDYTINGEVPLPGPQLDGYMAYKGGQSFLLFLAPGFLSDRRDYTGIMITDRPGKVLQEISQTGYGGFFESFHPFRSGMCWSPDGNSLAFVTKTAATRCGSST